MSTPAKPVRFLERLGLHRRELAAWATYDWANSAVSTTIIAAVFPAYFFRVVARDLPEDVATTRFTLATTVAMIVIALVSPVLGALADYRAIRKTLLAAFLAVGALGTSGLFFVQHGDWVAALLLFGVINVAAAGTFVFYDALLPHVARPDEMNRVSAAGYALGYLGGGLLLALNLTWIMRPAWFGLPAGSDLSPSDATLPTRLALVSVGAWWVLFAIPLFRYVPEPPRVLEADEAPGQSSIAVAFRRLGETFRSLRGFRNAFLMTLAFLVYNDGIMTIIRMGVLYGASLGLDSNALIGALLLAQVVGVPFAFLFGDLASRIGAKKSIYLGLAVYVGICLYAFQVETTGQFFVLAGLVAMVQGGSQAISRSLFASLIPRHKSAEFFSFFSFGEKFAGIAGPALFGVVVATTGDSRVAIVMVIVFFVVGATILHFVDVDEGQAAARRADAEVSAASAG